MVAIFFPRRFAMFEQVAANSGDRLAVCAAWFITQRSHAEPCLEMCPCRTFRSEPRTVGVSPAQLASLRALPNRLMSPISATMTSAVNSPTPGSVRSTPSRGSALARACSSPSIRSISGARPAGDRQAVGDDLPRRRGQVQLGQPAAARPGPVARAAVIAVVSGHRVDPVAQLRAEADQAGPVPQQRAEL